MKKISSVIFAVVGLCMVSAVSLADEAKIAQAVTPLPEDLRAEAGV